MKNAEPHISRVAVAPLRAWWSRSRANSCG